MMESFDTTHPMYVPLTKGFAIRMIELKLGAFHDPVEIQLSIHELEHAPEYDALSYVWGDPNDRTSIRCNGKVLQITKNLKAALRKVRHSDRSRFLWADAICINQGNDVEKSHHVAFMNRVYRYARAVLICLGEGNGVAAENVVTLIIEHIERRRKYSSLAEMPELSDDDPTLNDPRWNDLGVLTNCTWFGRTWVLQEAGVAANPTVLYGDAEFSYRDLMHLARWIVRCAPQLEPRAGISLLTVHTDWQDWSEDWRASQDYEYTLLDFLSHAKGLACQNALDHVYAFLGHPLLQKDDRSGPIIEPDYTLSVMTVFWQLTSQMLSRLGLLVLSAVEHDTQTIEEETLSWVVRWDMDIIQNSLGYYAGYYYRASGLDAPKPLEPLRVGQRELRVRSLLFDVVEYIYQFSANGTSWPVAEAAVALNTVNDLNDGLSQIWTRIHSKETRSVYAGPTATQDAFSLSLCAGLTNYLSAEADTKALLQHRANFEAFWALHDESLLQVDNMFARPQAVTAQTRSGDPDRFWYDFSLSSKGRCFFVTKTGYYGLGPWIMKAGDECHVLNEARVPFVLRKAADVPAYKVIGESYVHGIMHGELIREVESMAGWNETVLI